VNDFRSAISAVRELTRVVELVARLRGEIEPDERGKVSSYVLVFQGGAPKVLPGALETTTAGELTAGEEPSASADPEGELARVICPQHSRNTLGLKSLESVSVLVSAAVASESGRQDRNRSDSSPFAGR